MVKRRDRSYVKKYKPLTKWLNNIYGRDVSKVDLMLSNQNISVASFLDAESSVGVLRNYFEGLKVPTADKE